MSTSSPQAATAPTKYLIPENVYDFDHPEVIQWTETFKKAADKRNIFTNVKAARAAYASKLTSESMAAAWWEFTLYVPSFISKAVSQCEDPERQHHLIQIAYDELGGRDKDYIHSKLFDEAMADIGVKIAHKSSTASIKDVLARLDRTLTQTPTDSGIIGLLLSFEIIAEENIEMLFDCLNYGDDTETPLSASPFFKIHRADETEHIRHSVANFLRFCTRPHQRDQFMVAFETGLDFWQHFWDQVARIIILEHELRQLA